MSKRKPSAASASGHSAATKQGSHELNTLLLKEELLSEQVLVTTDLVQAINDSGIPLNLTIEHFDKFNSNKDKVKKLLEVFASIWKDEYFVKLCDILETVVSPWIADELRIELIGENGTQQISETLDLENGRIVFKEFGNEKRLSEQEKRRLHQLLNRKTQTTRDIWETQLNRVAAKVDAATKRSNTIDEEATRLAAEIQKFIAEHAGENFKNRGVTNGAQRTTDMFRTKSAVQQLERQLNFLIQLTGQCLMENDNINDEKRRVIEKIDSDAKQIARASSVKPAAIDVKLSQHIESKKQSIIDTKRAIEDQQRLAQQLSEELNIAEYEFKEVLDRKRKLIDELTQKVKVKESENKDVDQCVEQLGVELSQLQHQLENYSTRASRLERGTRLKNIFTTVAESNDETPSGGDEIKMKKTVTLPRINETDSSH